MTANRAKAKFKLSQADMGATLIRLVSQGCLGSAIKMQLNTSKTVSYLV